LYICTEIIFFDGPFLKRSEVVTIQVKDAEMIINTSLAIGGPPLMLIGPNGIGKTQILKTESLLFRNTIFTTAVEYAGFKQYEQLLKQKRIQNLVISDLQSILLRPQNVRGNVIRLISSLTSEGTQFELTYTKDAANIIDFSKRKKNYNLNVIIGGTEKHIKSLIREGYHDLLVRFVFVRIERDVETIDFKKPFELEIQPHIRYDKKRLREIYEKNETKNYHMLNARENMMFQRLQNGLQCLDWKPQGQVSFYRPAEIQTGKDVNLEARLTPHNV